MQRVGWQDKIRRQLDVVQQWRQSGQSIAAWAQAQGLDAKLLMGWVAYEKRWRQRLDQGQTQSHLTTAPAHAAGGAAAKSAAAVADPGAAGSAKPKKLIQGFVALQSSSVDPVQTASRAATDAASRCSAMAQPNSDSATVRIECAVAGIKAGLVLYWPLAQTQELAVWLKSMAAASDASLSGTSLSSTSTSGGESS